MDSYKLFEATPWLSKYLNGEYEVNVLLKNKPSRTHLKVNVKLKRPQLVGLFLYGGAFYAKALMKF
jgi:hypothetical protein